MARTLDILVSCIGLLLLAVPLALVGLLIKLNSRGSIFFRQERIGKEGEPFLIWKFRTMIDGSTDRGLGVTTGRHDKRITGVGCVLREWSIDEIPQLINVLKGEMTLVGPRPTLRYQVEQYDAEQRRRLKVKPGITSWASVQGRNALPWTERIELDLWYVQNRSLWLDIQIILRTFYVALIARSGVYGSGGVNDEFVPTTGGQEP